MKKILVTVILSFILLLLSFPLQFIGIVPLAFNDSGDTYINIVVLLIFAAILLGLYVGYFRISEIVLTTVSKKIQLNRKIYYSFSVVVPMFFLSMYIITYQPDSLLSKSYKNFSEKRYADFVQNRISDYESKISQSKHIAEFTMKDYTDLTVNFYIGEDEIISKFLYNDSCRYSSYKKFTSEEFYYLLNYNNQRTLENITSGSSKINHINFSSSNYFKYENTEFVTVKRLIDEFSFIKIDDNYYLCSFDSPISDQDDKEYRNLIERVMSNTQISSNDFYTKYDGERLYFKNLENPLNLYIDGDFFELNHTPFVILN